MTSIRQHCLRDQPTMIGIVETHFPERTYCNNSDAHPTPVRRHHRPLIQQGLPRSSFANMHSSAPQLAQADWPQGERRTAWSAALALKKDQGRRPFSPDDLRIPTSRSPRDLELPAAPYFRDRAGRPRLTRRDDVDHAAAFRSFDAAMLLRC